MPILNEHERPKDVGWAYGITTGIAVRRPCLLQGLTLFGGNSGAISTVKLYHGKDVGAGRIIGYFGSTGSTGMISFPSPLPCPNGIYAVLGGNCISYTVYWTAL